MAETATTPETGVDDLRGTWQLLRLTYGLVPIVAGLDKFTNVLVDWSTYLPGAVTGALPVEPAVFMFVVGIVEIVVGIAVLTRWTREGAYVVAAWLLLVALTLLLGGNFDVAVRDVVMAIGAVALARLTELGDY